MFCKKKMWCICGWDWCSYEDINWVNFNDNYFNSEFNLFKKFCWVLFGKSKRSTFIEDKLKILYCVVVKAPTQIHFGRFQDKTILLSLFHDFNLHISNLPISQFVCWKAENSRKSILQFHVDLLNLQLELGNTGKKPEAQT